MGPGGLASVAHAFSEGSRVRKDTTFLRALALMPLWLRNHHNFIHDGVWVMTATTG